MIQDGGRRRRVLIERGSSLNFLLLKGRDLLERERDGGGGGGGWGDEKSIYGKTNKEVF